MFPIILLLTATIVWRVLGLGEFVLIVGGIAVVMLWVFDQW
jgi:hypothetical protein